MRLIAAPITLLATAGLAALALAGAWGLAAPSNYLRVSEPPDLAGWDIHGARVEPDGTRAPAGGGSAAKVSATSGDAHIVLGGADIQGGAITLSVFLKADRRISLNLYLMSGKTTRSTVARLSPEWRRFSVTVPHIPSHKPVAMIGGGNSFAAGETIEIWGPQLNSGRAPSEYAAPMGVSSAWLERMTDPFTFRPAEQWVLAFGLACVGFSLAVALLWPAMAPSMAVAPLRRVQRLVAENRFFTRTALTYALIVAVTLLVLEAASLGIVVVRQGDGRSLGAAFDSALNRAPIGDAFALFKEKPFVGESTVFSPLTQVARLPGESLPPYLINKLGLVDNESSMESLRIMPEKPAGMTRIALYGGSTAMGIGAPEGALTITAQLERVLNERAAPGSAFQVLNFGHGGGQTFSDLGFLAAVGSRLDVDVSITLNGFNHAFFATESSGIYSSYDYLINWSDFSYHYSNVLNGLSPPAPVVVPLLPFTSLLFNELRIGAHVTPGKARKFYADFPMSSVTRYFDANHRRDELLRDNLRFMAGYFVNRKDQFFLSYLQPHPLQYRKLIERSEGGPTEATLVTQSIGRLSRHHHAEYAKRMIAMLDVYGRQYEALADEYRAYKNIRFVDLRQSLLDLPEPAYTDIAHYSSAAQRRLAERMLLDLTQLPLIRNRLAR